LRDGFERNSHIQRDFTSADCCANCAFLVALAEMAALATPPFIWRPCRLRTAETNSAVRSLRDVFMAHEEDTQFDGVSAEAK
jgi:hypothetical protein